MPPALVGAAAGHGVGPLLHARHGTPDLLPEAQARAMWELRHRHVLSGLLATLAGSGVRVVTMKGTALAYDLFAEPAQRPRGDTDLLVAPADLDLARAVLRKQGFRCLFAVSRPPDAGRSQEPWNLTAPDGSVHEIDLHWQMLNGPALAAALPLDEALAEAVPLPRLSPEALRLSRAQALIMACMHRARHVLSPYFVDGAAQYGGDRLIWLVDIDLLARALTAAEWDVVATRAISRGIAPVCLTGLDRATALLETPVPPDIRRRLAAAPGGVAARYLMRSGRVGRALADLRALGPRRALRHGLYRLAPPAEFVRMKYPDSRAPLPLLYLRRLAGLFRPGDS